MTKREKDEILEWLVAHQKLSLFGYLGAEREIIYCTRVIDAKAFLERFKTIDEGGDQDHTETAKGEEG